MIWIQISGSIGKALLEYSHAHMFVYYLHYLSFYKGRITGWSTSIEYLLHDPLQKKLGSLFVMWTKVRQEQGAGIVQAL